MHPTRDFILKTIEQFYNKSNLKLGDKSEDILSEFISNSHNLALQAYVINEDNLILLTQIQQIEDKCLILYKNSHQEPKGDGLAAINSINIMTLSNNVAESLYHSLKQVYTPILIAENDVYSVKLQKHLSDLESVLKVLTYGKDDSNTNVILSIEDELEYWKTIGQKKDVNKKDKEAVSTFCELFQDIIEEIRLIQSNSASEMREAAENIGGLLDDIWRFTTVPYSQNRMIHIFDIVGHIICSTLQRTLSSLDIWKLNNESKDYEILSQLSDSLKVVQTWTSACKTLTETYWPNYALHSWNGKPYVPLLCLRFEARLKEVHDIRSTHNQLNKLLTNNEKSELQTDTLFAPFQNINIWMYNGINTSWETAVSKFSASLRPAEAKIAEKLKPRLHNTSTRQMLYEFMRYRSLLERPLVKRALNNELEIFVSSLLSMLKNIQNQLESDEVDVKMYQPPEMTPIVHQIQWAKQMEAKVIEVQTCAEMYLKEFERSSELLKVTNHLLKDLKGMYTQLHEEWCRDLQARAKKGLLQLSRDTPVVKFNMNSKMMEVTYDGQLVTAEIEARSLAALSLPPPPQAAALDTLAATLAQARALHQVASFHNTLGERMIPSTRPMMLQAALELSLLVQDQKAVYWDDTEQLANYTDKLKNAVLKLEAQNTYLTSQHIAIRGVVEKLLDTELLAKQTEWKKGVKDIRDIIEKVEANGYKNTELWRSHWDWQLYKALECQYIKTLLSLHNHFPHVRVDLILRGHTVKVHPPMEELRVQHYHQLRRLVSLPALFVGLQNNLTDNSIFTAIVDKHSWLGNKAVNQLESALSSLERTCKSWTRRAALACVPDLEALCMEHLKEPSDWEVNFKACKAYGQAVAKMTFEDEKIEWITIGTTTLRREFEAQTRNLWAYLMSSLQVSCRNDATNIETFIANASVMLENKALPKNAKELTEISSKQQALQAKMPEMESTVAALKKKGYMLRTWGGDASVDDTVREWQKIREVMLSQQQMFEHQAEIVKSGLKGEWDNLNTNVEAFLSRWLQAKTRLEETQGVQYNEMVDRCRSVFEAHDQWKKFVVDRDDLKKECEKFNLDVDLPNIWQDTEKLVKGYLNLWTTLKEYNEEFETIANQDWIVFQKKLHLIDEFTAKWRSRLEPYTIVTLFIQQELNKYTDLTTILKYVRGTEFTERHWGEVFGLLEIEHKKPDTLLVKDFLGVADTIKLHIKTLQKICTTASSESAVRSALNELELWFAGARFAIAYYNDKAHKQTPIVKDFKDILNKIEEKQWVVSSLGGGAGGGASDDVTSSWEPRLRNARRLVRATHHAQRRSDSTVAKDGFALRWTSIDPVCGGELDASAHGHISSPGSPGKYPPNRDCYWHLTTTYGKRIQLHFFNLDIETHPNCSFDYLEIYDGMRNTDPLLNKYCNSTQPAPVQSASSNMLIHFHSDEYGSGNGFQISYAPIEGVPGCGGYFTTNVGEINSPSYNGSYLTNLLCEYKIRTDPDTKIRIDFKKFKLESSFKCKFDYLKIYDGPNSDSPLVGKFCGSEAYPKYYISSSNYLFLRFKTDITLSSEGFQIMYQANCLKTIHGDSGIIKSPGYPFSYPENKVCEYIISTSPGKAIELTFQDFDIEDNRHYQCAYDYVEIRDGPDSNSTLLGRYCGGSDHIPPTAISTHNYLYIKFNSDMSISGTGFYANYTTVDTECGGIFRKTTGLVNYPKDASDVYENDQSCTWILVAPEGMHIKLTWNRFDIERSPSCNNDYLELIELDDNNVNSSMGKFCGTKSPPALTSSSNRLLIKFVSDTSVRSSGFSLSYTYLDEKSHCGGTFFKTHGFIYSPGWPNRYEVNRDCMWTIIAPVGQQIRVNISQFDLERPIRDKCNHGDYLEFRNGASQTAPLIGQYCGKFNMKIIRTLGNSLFIYFHSDYYLTGSGFKLEWDGSLIGCGGTLTSSTGSLSSPNYPENYNENSECFYKIITNSGSRIRLSFTDLELERTGNCRDDYVEIYDGKDYDATSLGKYCYMSPELNNIETTSNYAFIKFRSDFYNEKKGFLLNYFTICDTNVTGRYGVIESPDFPNNYPLHLNCQWNIIVPKGNKINVTFTNFDIFKITYYRNWWRNYRRTEDCDQDFLQWKDSTENEFTKKRCGTAIPPMITSKSNLMQIKFSSGGLGSKSGFRLEWVNYGCGGHIQKPSGTISVDYLASSDEMECEWLIESSIGKSVSLVVTNLFMSYTENCTTDALEFYNGQDINSPPLSKVCSKHLEPLVIRSTANYMFIKFRKLSPLKGASFTSTFNSLPAICGGMIHTTSGFIYSKNYPKNYDDNLDCNWMLTVPKHHKILLDFIDFDLYSFNELDSDSCADSIKIFDRFSPSSNYTYRICPQSNVTKITTKRNIAMIQFTTNNFGNAKGFKIYFKATCGEEITAAYDGVISKAKYASETNTSCVWTIMSENLDEKISLTITHLHLPKPDNAIASNRSCQSSYLRVYDGNDINAPIVDEYCGSKAPPIIISRGSALTVVFDSYDKKYLGQFSAHYSTLSTACGGSLSSEEGSIVSPNYPRAYPAGVDCEWTLSTSPGNRAYITFEQFNLENSVRCNEDYLEIRKNNGAGELLGVYCGNDIPVNTSVGEKLYIKFHSNNDNSGQGFLLHYGFLHGNDIVGLDRGQVASPLYPHMYHGVGEYSWRIFTKGSSSITMTVDVFEIHSYTETCLSKLTFFDGYDDTAPLLIEMCGVLTGQRRVLRSSSNVIYIKLIMDESNSGALFLIGWHKSDKLHEDEETEKKINCGSNDTMLILPGDSSIIVTPNYPQDYNDNSNCEWMFQSFRGRHLSVHFLDFEIEENSNCFADSISIYSSETPGLWKPLIEKVCEFDRVKEKFNASTYLKINFISDSSVTRKGFKAIVKSECGGKITDLSGEVGPTWNDKTDHVLLNKLQCDWTVTVRPGRIVQLQFIHFNITNKEDKCMTYVILRNGDSVASPLLSSGKYCGYSHEIKDQITTSSNSFHISFFASMPPNVFQTFKIRYEEKNIECGATSVLDADHSWEVISSPNYPDLPVPFSECIWKFSGPPGEVLRIDFIDRFDLDYTSDCGTEVLQIRDGSSGLAPLKHSFCGEKPPTVKNSGNTMYIRYMTQLSVPRNGFKANISIDICGGTIIAESGELTSPGYPHKHTLPYPSDCEWRIRGRPSHILTIVPKDIELPESESPCATKLTIEEPIPGNNSVALLKTYCRNYEDLNMDPVQTFGNEVIIKFHIRKPSEWSRGAEERGFRFIFNSSKPSCGGAITTSEGYLTTPGYPMETTLIYCQWTITVPNKSRRIRLQLLDVDTEKQDIYIANDLSFGNIIYSTIRVRDNSTLSSMRTFESSGSGMSIFILLKHRSTKSHKFKAKFSSDEEAYCGGQLSGLNGELVSPDLNRSLFCEWDYNNILDNTDDKQYIYNSILVSVTINSSATNSRCRMNDPKLTITTSFDKKLILFPFTRTICTNSEISYRLPSPSFHLKSSKKNADLLNFNLKWKAQPCGGIIEVGDEPINVLNITNSYNDTLDCAWIVRVPYGNRVDIKIEGLFDYNCDDEFINIKQGLSQYVANTGSYCKTNMLEQPLKVNYRYIYVEYHSKPKNTNSLKLIVTNSKSQCGGELSNYRRLLESPNYPKNYDAYLECVWTITTSLGNRISLNFVDRFVIEDRPNCTKDAVILYDWKDEAFNEIARLCGRQIPMPYNSTANKMKIVFRTDESTNMEGFKAIWKPFCGGNYVATEKQQFLYNPGYPNYYSGKSNCTYKISAPVGENLLIKFHEFNLEGKLPECEYDNLTISSNSDYRYLYEVYCGTDIPHPIINYDKVTLTFKSDRFLQRSGFKLSYEIYSCNSEIKEPRVIGNDDHYDDNSNCTWRIEAPSDKIIVFRFLYIDIESHYDCYNDFVAVYEDVLINEDKRLALLCGHVNLTTVVRTNSNKALLHFKSDSSYNFRGFKVHVIFSYSESVGCGGHIDMTSLTTKTLKSFILNNKVVYENYLDCRWTLSSAVDTVMKIEFTSFHISPCRNVNQTALGYSNCSCDFVEIKDSLNPDGTTIGTYCGHNLPPPLISSTNSMSIRLSTDGEIVSSGFEVKITVQQSLCGHSHFTVSDHPVRIKSPGFENGQLLEGLHCNYYFDAKDRPYSQIRISFVSLDLHPGIDDKSNKCNRDKVVITQHSFHNTSNDKNFIKNYNTDPFFSNNLLYYDETLPPRAIEICGSKKPSDLYVTGSFAITLKTSTELDSVRHKGFEMEISYAGFCGRNYTDPYGKIQALYSGNYEEVPQGGDCFTLITAPANCTISAYFVSITPIWNTNSYLQIFDGNNIDANKLVTINQNVENIYPYFSTGRYMLLRNHKYADEFVNFDLNYVTTDKGRGCGGKLINQFGRITSPMYPDIYRHKSTCEWELETPLGTRIKLHFAVFDLIVGGNSCDQNYLQLVNSKGEVISSYCSEKPADFVSSDNYVKIVFYTTLNNGGTGWMVDFYGILKNEDV